MIFAERLAELGEEHFDGIEPGEVTASVEIGDQSLSPLIAGIVRTTLIAGQTTKLTLHLDPMRMPAAVAVAGTLFVPAEWMATRAADDCALYIAPLDLRGHIGADERCLAVTDMAAQPGRPGWYRWDAGKLLAATYQFMMPRVGFSRVVKIEPPRQDSLEFVVAEPALLHVRVVSEASGAPLHPWSLQWIPEPPEGSTQAGDPIELEPDDAMAVYSAHVPVGAGRVVCMIDHGCVLDDDSATAVIHSGEQELTVRAHPGCGVALEGLEHGTPVDWPDEFADDVRVEAVGHSGRGAAIGAAGSQLLVVVTAPGSYRVTLPTLPDCVPIAPFVVDVPAGEFVKRTVELTRK
jgi:hypothetical protein